MAVCIKLVSKQARKYMTCHNKHMYAYWPGREHYGRYFLREPQNVNINYLQFSPCDNNNYKLNAYN